MNGLCSVITRCELLAGAAGAALVRRLLDPFREPAVDRDVAERAGRIRLETGIATSDALTAATAIERDLTLITRNRKHFELVKKLSGPRYRAGVCSSGRR